MVSMSLLSAQTGAMSYCILPGFKRHDVPEFREVELAWALKARHLRSMTNRECANSDCPTADQISCEALSVFSVVEC